jgi:LacI family transcriptional regulator/LacI family repressor for deo operon, udp, cdd, tsx, nupC, and nupG
MAAKRVSIKDIAEAAGVSHPTVSRALRGQGRVAQETRSRILALAEEMGYTPSLVARGLVNQRSYSVGMVVTTIADPFYHDIVRGVEDTALANGYTLYLATTNVDPDREMQVVANFQGHRVDGIIVASSRVGARYADLLSETGVPIVLVNSHADHSNIHSIAHDDYGGFGQIVQHVIDRGYGRIAYLGNGRAGRAEQERRRAWRDILSQHGHTPAVSSVGPTGRQLGGTIGVQSVLDAAAAHWHDLPDAICCYNDTMAIGALKILREQGIRVPQDVALTGVDDIDMSAYTQPSLTTWRQPRYEMGVQAMALLLAQVNDARVADARVADAKGADDPSTAPSPMRQEIITHGELIVRDST